MAEFRNPAILDDSAGAPANGTVAVYDAATDTWVATAIASIGSPLTVPGTHIAQIATANATDLASAEALANALKASYNTLLTELQTAGVLASS